VLSSKYLHFFMVVRKIQGREAGRLLGDQLKRGSRYLEVKRVYQIIFMDFTLFPGKDMVPMLPFRTETWFRRNLRKMRFLRTRTEIT
jgi:hypothetical protein